MLQERVFLIYQKEKKHQWEQEDKVLIYIISQIIAIRLTGKWKITINTNRRRIHDSILSGSNFKSPQNDTSNQPNKKEQQRKQESMPIAMPVKVKYLENKTQ
jgi:hypothetical protein